MSDLKTLTRDEQEILIRLYANRMEQCLNQGQREAAVGWMNSMYEAIKARNLMILKGVANA